MVLWRRVMHGSPAWGRGQGPQAVHSCVWLRSHTCNTTLVILLGFPRQSRNRAPSIKPYPAIRAQARASLGFARVDACVKSAVLHAVITVEAATHRGRLWRRRFISHHRCTARDVEARLACERNARNSHGQERAECHILGSVVCGHAALSNKRVVAMAAPLGQPTVMPSDAHVLRPLTSN